MIPQAFDVQKKYTEHESLQLDFFLQNFSVEFGMIFMDVSMKLY